MAPPPNTITLGIMFQHMDFWKDTNSQSVAHGDGKSTCRSRMIREFNDLISVKCLDKCLAQEKQYVVIREINKL